MISLQKALLLLSMALSVLSCKPANLTSDLKVTIGPSPVNALPTTLSSCKALATDGDLAANSFNFTTFKYQWTGSNPMQIAFITINFKSGLLVGGSYQCIISGDELTAVLTPNEGGIAGGDNTTHTTRCGLRCGSLKFNGNVTSAYLVGTVKIVGTEIDSEGNQTPFATQSDVAVQYTQF